MAGNVYQWNKNIVGSTRMRGARPILNSAALAASTSENDINPTNTPYSVGFRLVLGAPVPEPSSLALLAGGVAGLLAYACAAAEKQLRASTPLRIVFRCIRRRRPVRWLVLKRRL